LPIIALVLLLVLLAFTNVMPDQSLSFLTHAGAIWSLVLFCAVPAVLLWFIYRVFLRRILRARRIAHIRMRRLMEEAAERGMEGGRQ
jgi:O-antigen/teichoic acid export membrane protein